MASSTSSAGAGRPLRSFGARALAVALAAELLSGGPVRAEAPRSDEAARSAARAKLVEGVDALGRGLHQRALERFQEAYALVPSPKIHYDFGLAYVGLGRNAEALAAFERFLADAPDAPVDKREKAAQRALALRAQVGAASITVDNAPDGAAVTVDGRDVGRVPLARPVYLDPGRHAIAVRLAGGQAGPVEQIDVQGGGSVEVVLRVPSGGPVAASAAPVGGRPISSVQRAAPAPHEGAPPDATPGAKAPRPEQPEDPLRTRRLAALSIGGAGVVLLGAGLTFGVLAKRESDSLSNDSATSPVSSGTPTMFDPEKEARGTRYEVLQVIGLAAGAVGIVAGVVLYAGSRGRVTVEPGAARALAGANLQVRF
jgi:hypothetical protein